MARGEPARGPTRAERLSVIERHIGWIQRAVDDPKSLSNHLKKYVAAYSRGLRGSAKFRQRGLYGPKILTNPEPQVRQRVVALLFGLRVHS